MSGWRSKGAAKGIPRFFRKIKRGVLCSEVASKGKTSKTDPKIIGLIGDIMGRG